MVKTQLTHRRLSCLFWPASTSSPGNHYFLRSQSPESRGGGSLGQGLFLGNGSFSLSVFSLFFFFFTLSEIFSDLELALSTFPLAVLDRIFLIATLQGSSCSPKHGWRSWSVRESPNMAWETGFLFIIPCRVPNPHMSDLIFLLSVLVFSLSFPRSSPPSLQRMCYMALGSLYLQLCLTSS